MCAQTIDRRISTSAASCNNCGLDAGNYPNMHKCQQQQCNPYLSPLPPLPTRQLSSNSNPLHVPRKPIHSPSSSGSSSRFTSTSSSSTFSSCSSPNLSDAATASPSPLGGKWSQFSQKLNNKQQQQLYLSDSDDNSNYLNSFEAHLPEQEKKRKSLWGKVRQTQKWEQWTQHGDISKPGGKLWGKLRWAAQNMADKIPSHEDKGPESDESDWEGETHVSRILREYYVKKRRSLPSWLRDEGTTQRYANPNAPSPVTPSRRRRLWDGDLERRPPNYDQQQSTSREINFDHVQQQQQKQPNQHHQTNHSEYHHYRNTPYSQCNRNDNDDIRRRHHASNNQRLTNDQPYRCQSYQTSPPLTDDMEQKRRFSMGYISPTAPQRQYDNEDGRYQHSTATSHQDRLHGPRTRPSKRNQY